MKMYKRNYPIDSDIRVKFWSSSHIENRVKAIIAFSWDLDNATDNLRRELPHLSLGWRERNLEKYKQYVNNPDFKGVPYTTI